VNHVHSIEPRRDAGLNAHIYPSPIRHESRMLKISRTLAGAGIFSRICLIGMAEGAEDVEERERLDDVRQIWRLRTGARRRRGVIGKAMRFAGWWRSVWRALDREQVQCINAHSLSVLPLAVALKFRHRARLIYDTHELETETATSRGLRRVLSKAVERILLPFADETSVVNDAIADWYRGQYRLRRVHVVKNVPYELSVPPSTAASPLRQRLGIDDNHLVFLYQGVIGTGRGIDLLIDAFAGQDADRHLVFMGYGALVGEIISVARERPNVHHLPAVPPEVLPSYTMGADVGLAMIEDVSLSYHYCLPNKLFEYLACGLPVIASDLPCMRDLIETESCGWLASPDSTALAALVRGITREDVERLRPRALGVQRRHSWEREVPSLLAIYRDIPSRPDLSPSR